jgi:signal transduction histidine kinase
VPGEINVDRRQQGMQTRAAWRKRSPHHSTSTEESQLQPTSGGGPRSGDHVVQFYQSDDFVNDAVASYLAEGLERTQPLVVIATDSRIDSVQWRLANRGYDVDRAHRQGNLVLMNARETLSSFMVGSMPDERRFEANLGRVIARSARVGREAPVRAYGEMVDVLWREGNRRGALQVEELWNELARRHSFSLLCAYAMSNFQLESDAEEFRSVCQAHQHVRAAETYDAAADEATRARQITLLQQRAQALEHEIEERRNLEGALREALAERLRTEEALRSMKEKAERASEAKSQFLAVVSHELRTPLNAIVGYQDLLSLEVAGPLSGGQRGYLARIRSASEQLLRLIDQILSLSRIAAGREVLALERIDLSRLAGETVAMVGPAAAAKGLALRVRVPDAPVECVSDPAKLGQVLLNLISNAVKFTDRGGVEVVVAQEGARVAVHVRDTGPGIPDSDRARIFEPFVQADASATRRHGGTGLGLPVSRELAWILGGEVRLQSVDGEGSTFTVEIPAAAP